MTGRDGRRLVTTFFNGGVTKVIALAACERIIAVYILVTLKCMAYKE